MSLAGKRVLITRTRHQASELAAALEVLGAIPILIPTIEILPPACYSNLDAAIAGIDTFNWVVFTSSNGVEAFSRRLALASGEKTLGRKWKLAAIGPSTGHALEAIGLRPDLIPLRPVSESLAEALLPYAQGSRMLLVRPGQAREHLPEVLRTAGADLTIAEAYRTVIPEDSIASLRTLFTSSPPDAITFSSSSTVVNLLALLDAAKLMLPVGIVRASIGRITSQTLTSRGFPPQIEASEATVQSLVRGLAAYFTR